MNLAQELRDLVVEENTERLEFRRAGYHLSLNPVGTYHDELGFILWEVDGSRLDLMVTGRTHRNRLIVDDPDYDGDPAELEAVLRAMITGEVPVIVRRDPVPPHLVGTH